MKVPLHILPANSCNWIPSAPCDSTDDAVSLQRPGELARQDSILFVGIGNLVWREGSKDLNSRRLSGLNELRDRDDRNEPVPSDYEALDEMGMAGNYDSARSGSLHGFFAFSRCRRLLMASSVSRAISMAASRFSRLSHASCSSARLRCVASNNAPKSSFRVF
jgi:hypothetical protein